MKNLILTLTSALVLTACSGGGGGSSAKPGDDNESATLSWVQSTVAASTNYMKTNDQITLTVTVRASNGSVMDLDRDFQVMPLCAGCVNQMQPLAVTDFTLVSKGVYTHTFTAQDTSEVSFMLIYYGGSEGAPADTVPNQPKLSLVAWETCVEPLQNGQNFRQVTSSGITYNAICSADDLRKLRHSLVVLSPAMLNANYVLLKDIVLTSPEQVIFGTSNTAGTSASFTGIFDGNGRSVTGSNFSIIRTNGAVIRNLTVQNKDRYLSSNLLSTTIDQVNVSITDIPGNVGFGTCQSVSITNSGSLTCATNI